MEKLFDVFRRLGKPEKINKSELVNYYSAITSKQGFLFRGVYLSKVDFDSGPVEVIVTAVHSGNEWKVLGFRINSTALLECPPPAE